ncbi:MAG: YdeI/OmpD-associated family protein [Saprospiraceae bacterium]
MSEEKLLVNKKLILEKYPGKGGWIYAIIPEVAKDKNSPFGWVKVKGTIDDFKLKNYKLMPLGTGQLFLPVRAEIRKKIRKKEGDWVHVNLYLDNSPTEIPVEILDCFKDHPVAYKTFLTYTDGQKKEFIDWIYSAKTDKTKVQRIAIMLNKLVKKEKFRDKK